MQVGKRKKGTKKIEDITLAASLLGSGGELAS
jgi:hypothetical protein